MIQECAPILLALLCGHGVSDTLLQGRFVSYGKDRHHPIPHAPWWVLLGWHSFMHALCAGAITHNPLIGAMEFSAHTITDLGKAEKLWGTVTDQMIHVAFKVLWCWIWYLGNTRQ